jgi:hypothetical protein
MNPMVFVLLPAFLPPPFLSRFFIQFKKLEAKKVPDLSF